jgi:hypothetical protein
MSRTGVRGVARVTGWLIQKMRYGDNVELDYTRGSWRANMGLDLSQELLPHPFLTVMPYNTFVGFVAVAPRTPDQVPPESQLRLSDDDLWFPIQFIGWYRPLFFLPERQFRYDFHVRKVHDPAVPLTLRGGP